MKFLFVCCYCCLSRVGQVVRDIGEKNKDEQLRWDGDVLGESLAGFPFGKTEDPEKRAI